jgi:hypothetical protein
MYFIYRYMPKNAWQICTNMKEYGLMPGPGSEPEFLSLDRDGA